MSAASHSAALVALKLIEGRKVCAWRLRHGAEARDGQA